MRAGCEGGVLGYRESHSAPPTSWTTAVVPNVPTDASRAFCYPSFVDDALGLLYVSDYDADASTLAVYKNNPANPAVWTNETADTTGDVGRYTSIVYDPVGKTVMVAYHDATNGKRKLASRPANQPRLEAAALTPEDLARPRAGARSGATLVRPRQPSRPGRGARQGGLASRGAAGWKPRGTSTATIAPH